MLRSFICKTRSSTGLRVISASENKLKSPKTADEYSLQKHDGKRDEYDYEGEKKLWSRHHAGVKSRPVAMSRLCSSGSTCPLIGWGLWGPRDLEGGNTRHPVVETLLHSTAVDHVLDSRDGQRRLGHVGGDHTQTGAGRRRPENLRASYGLSYFNGSVLFSHSSLPCVCWLCADVC